MMEKGVLNSKEVFNLFSGKIRCIPLCWSLSDHCFAGWMRSNWEGQVQIRDPGVAS